MEHQHPANVYVLRTHVLNQHVLQTFQKMQQQLGKENVFVLFDETNGAPGQPSVRWDTPGGVSTGPAIITINETDCQNLNKFHNQGKYPGSMHKVEAQVYACYKAINRPYEYLWFIEYDVYCNDFEAALRRFNKVKADMLTKGTTVNYFRWLRSTLVNRKWMWWHKLEGEISQVPLSKRRGCFFPVNRFSRRFLQVIEANLSKSSGYCEVYFPTLCRINGLKVKTMPLNTFGTFRYRPNITAEEVSQIKPTDHRLYHPVKNL